MSVGTGFAAVAAGAGHTLAVKSDGTLWAWGRNSGGELGDGTKTQRPSPVQVGSGFRSVAANTNSYAEKSDGTLLAWGPNDGLLGDDTVLARTTPVPVINFGGTYGAPGCTVTITGDAASGAGTHTAVCDTYPYSVPDGSPFEHVLASSGQAGIVLSIVTPTNATGRFVIFGLAPGRLPTAPITETTAGVAWLFEYYDDALGFEPRHRWAANAASTRTGGTQAPLGTLHLTLTEGAPVDRTACGFALGVPVSDCVAVHGTLHAVLGAAAVGAGSLPTSGTVALDWTF